MKNLRLTEWELGLDDESDLPDGIAFSHAEEEISPDQHRELEEFLKAAKPVPDVLRGGETQTRFVPEQ
mgnify:CR=1 FL=1